MHVPCVCSLGPRSSALSGVNVVFLRDDINRRPEISCLHVISPTYSILDLGSFVNLRWIYTSKLWEKLFSTSLLSEMVLIRSRDLPKQDTL